MDADLSFALLHSVRRFGFALYKAALCCCNRWVQSDESSHGPLRILHLEDDDVDAALIRHELARENFAADLVQVKCGESFRKALREQQFGLILADCALPSFSGLEALEISRREAPGAPFIFVSGTMGEELAVDCVKRGATDYVLKDRLVQLAPAVRRALRERDDHRAHEKALDQLRQNEKDLADFFEHAPIGLSWASPDGRILKVNQAELDMLGYSAKDYLGRPVVSFHHQPQAMGSVLEEVARGESVNNFESRMRCRDGSSRDVLISINGLWEKGRLVHTRCFTRDITQLKQEQTINAAFSGLALKLSSAAAQQKAAQVIIDAAASLLEWDSSSLDLYLSSQGVLERIMAVEVIEGRQVQSPVSSVAEKVRPGSMAERVLLQGGQLVMGEEALTTADRPAASVLAVPVRNGARVIGILAVQSYTAKAYSQGDLNTLQALADHCGGALERIRTEENVTLLNIQLLAAARRAGMEEVASSVLHNVGNVLNTVNVSATTLTEKITHSRLAGIVAVAEMLHKHTDDLYSFLTANVRGKQLPEYLSALGRYWTEEQALWVQELKHLAKYINHIKEIISRQQSLAGPSSEVDSVMLSDLLEDALAIAVPNLERWGMTLRREYQAEMAIQVDKRKFILIVVNLLKNAKEALLACDRDDKELIVRTQPQTQGHFCLQVIDNGAGITPENLAQVGSRGFSTKKGGHGFGLHSSTLIARELGGSLSFHSDGLGQGSCFTLMLPLSQGHRKEARP
ncbi:MAG TPA: ATP-binding protein [Candidatus Saccharimonadales bacterium]|nr:ATP-binding protein [Candidatus Saccharimonadales bacterium]